MSVADTAKAADVIMLLAPDTEQKAVYDADIAPNKDHPIEAIGAELRAMMPFINAGKQKVAEDSGGDS